MNNVGDLLQQLPLSITENDHDPPARKPSSTAETGDATSTLSFQRRREILNKEINKT